MNWIQENFKKIIYVSFLIPIILVALVSISHVTKWYGISNPLSWAIYLSVGIEIAALSALAAISAKMGRKVYFPFGIVTLIQFIGNIFFAYQFIDINSEVFKNWVDLVSPIVSFLGVEPDDPIGHKRFLAFFSGGMLPMISLSFLHMLVKFEETDKLTPPPSNEDIPEIEQNFPIKVTPQQEIPEILESIEDLPEVVESIVEDSIEIPNEDIIETPIENNNNTINLEENKINRLVYVNRNGENRKSG